MSSFDIITFSFVCVFKQARVKQHYFLTDLRWNRVGFLYWTTAKPSDIWIINMDVMQSVQVAGSAPLVCCMALILKHRLYLMS